MPIPPQYFFNLIFVIFDEQDVCVRPAVAFAARVGPEQPDVGAEQRDVSSRNIFVLSSISKRTCPDFGGLLRFAIEAFGGIPLISCHVSAHVLCKTSDIRSYTRTAVNLKLK
jgi:hypothetical protein